MFTTIYNHNPQHEPIHTEITAMEFEGLGVYVRTCTKHSKGITEFALFIDGATLVDNKIVKGE